MFQVLSLRDERANIQDTQGKGEWPYKCDMCCTIWNCKQLYGVSLFCWQILVLKVFKVSMNLSD